MLYFKSVGRALYYFNNFFERLFTVFLPKGQSLCLFSDSQPQVLLNLTPLECTLMPLKSQSKVRRPCR